MQKIIMVLVGIGVLSGVLYFSGLLDGFLEGFVTSFEGHSGLPSCGSSHGQSDAKKAIENSPLGKSLNLSVIAVTDIRTILANGHEVECTANVILNSAKKGGMNYSFTKDPSLGTGNYYIRAELDQDSFKPYP